MTNQIKICIAGKNNIAVDVLAYILAHHIAEPEEVVVVCNRTETGRNSWQKSLRFFAGKWGVKEVSLEDVYVMEDVLFLSLEFDRIVHPDKFVSSYLYNIHFSKLPSYKGMYTSVMPILNHEETVGVTFHHIDAGIDTGDIVAQSVFPLMETDTAQDLYAKYITHGLALVERQLARMQAEGKDLPARAQDVNGSTYYSRASLDFGHICLDCRQTAAHIAAQVRAVTFRVYQLPSFEGVPIRFCHILRARSQAKPGQILRRTENGFLLSSVDYDVVLFVDQFASLMAYVAQNNPSGLQRIPYWQAYLQDFETEHGRTPLMVAAAHGYVELAMQLIEAGADIHARDYMGASLLFYAMRGYGINGDDRLLAYLQDHGLSMIDENYEGQSVQKICQAHGNKLLNSISSSCTGG